jgi:hypothetical protein
MTAQRLHAPARAAFALAAAFTVAIAAGTSANASDAFAGTWRINYESASTIDLELSYRNGHHSWDSGDTIAFDSGSFAGLTINDVKSAKGDRHFRIVRDAGSLDCIGYFASGIGSGIFTFAPSTAFASGLEARGLGRPDVKDQFELAMADVTMAMVDRLVAAGVKGRSSKALVTLANHGVGPQYVSGLDASGVRAASVDDLLRLRDHDVEPNYVAGLARYGYHPAVDDLVRLRDHDVSLDFVARLKAHGYHPSVDELIRLRDAGL